MTLQTPPLVWFKASDSNGTGGNNCVEAARLPDGMAVRDSKNPDAGMFRFGVGEWNAFLDGVRRGEFDL